MAHIARSENPQKQMYKPPQPIILPPDELWQFGVEQGEHVEQDEVLVIHILKHVPDAGVELLRAHSVADISLSIN